MNRIKVTNVKMTDEVIERKVWFNDTEIEVNGVKHLVNGWIWDTETYGDYEFTIGGLDIFDALDNGIAEDVIDLLREY